MNYEKAFKTTVVSLAVLVGSLPTVYNVGKNIGYYQGFEDTKTEIRQSVVATKKSIYEKEKQARNYWWNWTDTTLNYTLGDVSKHEANSFKECYIELDDLINYRIDNLTAEDVKESAEFDKKYNNY